MDGKGLWLVCDRGYNREWWYHKKEMQWLTRDLDSDVIGECTLEQTTYHCWKPLALAKEIQQITICYADVDNTPTTYQFPSSTLSAWCSSHLQFTTISGSISSSSYTRPTLAVQQVDPPNSRSPDAFLGQLRLLPTPPPSYQSSPQCCPMGHHLVCFSQLQLGDQSPN